MKKWTKSAIATTFGASLLLTTIVPTVKAEQQEPQLEISDWAFETIAEGEKYGIHDFEWYYDGFLQAISVERLDLLLQATEQKLAALELKKNKKFKPVAVKNNNTRRDVVNRLYNIVAQYDTKATRNAVNYLRNENILRGSGSDLRLDDTATTQEAVILAIRTIEHTYAKANVGAKGLAWVVEDEDTRIYLLGSIHYGIPDLYPINKQLIDAFNDSNALIVEVDILDDSNYDYYDEKAFYSEGQSLKDDISEETYAKLVKVAELEQVDVEQLESIRPWALSSFFNNRSSEQYFGLTVESMAWYGIDQQFLLSAYLQQKPIYELEGMEVQVDMLSGLSLPVQEQLLAETLDSILNEEDETPLLDQWFMDWRIGNIEGFEESFSEVGLSDDEYEKALFGKRDADMAQQLIDLLENVPGIYFVVVGAGHFVVDQNIRYHLEQAGYTVKPFYN